MPSREKSLEAAFSVFIVIPQQPSRCGQTVYLSLNVLTFALTLKKLTYSQPLFLLSLYVQGGYQKTTLIWESTLWRMKHCVVSRFSTIAVCRDAHLSDIVQRVLKRISYRYQSSHRPLTR